MRNTILAACLGGYVALTFLGPIRQLGSTTDLAGAVGNTSYVIVVPAGFVTDFASTRRAIWAVLPPVGRYQLAAVVHDFLYWDQGCTREQADTLLWVAMAESQVAPSSWPMVSGRRQRRRRLRTTAPRRSRPTSGSRSDSALSRVTPGS
jgi:Protein of unknown function (DUF1353)